MSRFEGYWSSKEDLERDFDHKIDHEIIYASYEDEAYEGWCYVLSEKDGELYETESGHCSCNGLEGSWTPCVTNREALQKTLDSEKKYNSHPALIQFLTEYLA